MEKVRVLVVGVLGTTLGAADRCKPGFDEGAGPVLLGLSLEGGIYGNLGGGGVEGYPRGI